jgi:beta-galactosidase
MNTNLGKLADAFHIYCTTTTDFKTFTPTKLFYSKEGENEIDATLLYDTDNNEWLLFNKIWSTGIDAIDVLKSASLEGPWTLLSKNIIPKIIGEGPTSVKIGKYYHVYFDKYKENHMGLTRSTDLIEWEDMSSHIKFPPHAKHGTVFKVTPDIVKLISSAGL